MVKPVIFTDLDDTLFQTSRKMVTPIPAYHTATLNKQERPHSMMTQEQFLLVTWMLTYADLIPVTARSTEEMSRVLIPFNSWRITTHGAVIITPEGKKDTDWQQLITQHLASYSQRLLSLEQQMTQLITKHQIDAYVRVHYEYNKVPIYITLKHKDNTKLNELYALSDELEQTLATEDLYLHRNSNNIAWLPEPIEKGKAVHYLLEKLKAERGIFPVIGFGDSLSDHRFLQLCSWYGVPQTSQFANAIQTRLFGEQK